MMKRLAAVAAATLLTTATALSVATPAQAWRYCDHTDRVLRVTTYEKAGYCGTKAGWVLPSSGDCVSMYGVYRNTIDAAVNYYPHRVRFYSGLACTGPGYTLGDGNSHPNLSATGVGGNNAESMRLCVPGGKC